MPVPEATEIRIDGEGTETHQSWVLIRANHVTSNPGAQLFDSEIRHTHLIRVTISRCKRTRDLNRDWLFDSKLLMELDMSQAQWGAFVSSFGQGTGVPATLAWFDGDMVPGVSTNDSRLAESHKDVRAAADKAVEKVVAAQQALEEAFARNAGKKEMRELVKKLGWATQNLPKNIEFAAESLTEHVENVVVKARGDIEAMAVQAAHSGLALDAGSLPVLEIEE